jgi:branched-chain amino acid transport system ATP-binding protein
MFLELKNLSVNYGKLSVLKDISFEIKKGKTTFVLGANGAGKSTLFKTISGLKRTSSGNIWFEGERIDTLAPNQILRRGIAQVPEGKRIFKNMSVLQNLKVGGYSRKDSKQMIATDREALLERFPVLKEKGHVKAGLLSGGQQQSLVIARALMARPKLLLLDEPTQGLAPMVVQEIAEVIRDVRDRGITVMVIEHNIPFARALAERVCIMENCRLAYLGDAGELSEDELVQKIYLGAE